MGYATLVAIAVVCVVAAPVGAATAVNGVHPNTTADDCFPADGYSMTIGDQGPHLNVTVHASLFTNLSTPGVVGLEATGIALDQSLVVLRTGVVFDGVDNATALTRDPLSRFSVVHRYALRLPMFDATTDGEFAYETDQPPVSDVNASTCAGPETQESTETRASVDDDASVGVRRVDDVARLR